MLISRIRGGNKYLSIRGERSTSTKSHNKEANISHYSMLYFSSYTFIGFTPYTKYAGEIISTGPSVLPPPLSTASLITASLNLLTTASPIFSSIHSIMFRVGGELRANRS
mmetsp:Transcript_37223/g.75828  ORF Transcript_37223/g.75828 Transcript_37223/m.75828 type:complete len:110 (-) Transcript_37223:518-847(-)